MPTHRVRDPIHQFVHLEPEEWTAVDTPVFQRLRRIGQLAMTHLVYPGTTHTRFEHSIGVRHVASLLCDQLALSEDDRRPVLHAALLHDVGHGPFSHVSEQVLDQLSGAKNVHEAISVALIRTDDRLREALGAENCDAAANLVEGGKQSVERDIISGTTDADKLDYLRRDSYFAGVEYGKFDFPRVIERARVLGDREAQTYLGFSTGGLWAVEGLLLARHHMFRQVYGHKTRIATDIMVTRALTDGIENGVLPRKAFEVPTEDGEPRPTKEFLDAFLEQTDASVSETLRAADEGSIARDLMDRLLERKLIHRVESVALHLPSERLDSPRRAQLQDEEQFTHEDIARIEAEIAEATDTRPHLVAIDIDRWSNPTYRRPGGGGGSMVQLVNDEGNIVYLHEASEIFDESYGIEQAFLNLYMPEVNEEAEKTAKELLWTALRNG